MSFEKLADAVQALNDGCDKLGARMDAAGAKGFITPGVRAQSYDPSKMTFAQRKKALEQDRKAREMAKSLSARKDAWGSWKEWNDEYTKMLQKRNAAQRSLDKLWSDPVAYKRMQEKVAKLEQDCRVFFNNPDRPQVSSTQAFGRQR